jgi:hypothetical protein
LEVVDINHLIANVSPMWDMFHVSIVLFFTLLYGQGSIFVNLDLLGWIATGLSISGAILNAWKRVEGFYLWLIGNALWIWFGVVTHAPYIILLFSVYSLISLFGIYTWRKKI